MVDGGSGEITGLQIAKRARKALGEKKGTDVRLFDVRGLSGVTDYYLIVSGNSPPHLKAMYNGILHDLKQKGAACYRKSGDPESGWMVIDYIDVVIHILLAEKREYYALEALWAEAPLVK
jgi:ribosome-associated protein